MREMQISYIQASASFCHRCCQADAPWCEVHDFSFEKSQFGVLTCVCIPPVNSNAFGHQFPLVTFTHDLPEAVQVRFLRIIPSCQTRTPTVQQSCRTRNHRRQSHGGYFLAWGKLHDWSRQLGIALIHQYRALAEIVAWAGASPVPMMASRYAHSS